MSTVKIKLTDKSDKEYGYVGLESKKFIFGVSIDEAIVFKRIEHKQLDDAFYYEVTTKRGKYMDQHTKDGDVFLESPLLDVHKSTIWAWAEIDGFLCAVSQADSTGKQKLSLPRNEKQEKMKPNNALFSNILGDVQLSVEIISQ